MKKHIYMIGNAHLDPVWMWQWQEGYAEVKATFRSALDRMKEFPEFKFTCAAAITYQWIEECCPEMFEEIRQRVREGRWILAGGWWIQPDCNLPCGESFIRHGLLSQRYFYEKFGKTATVGYNVDSFGHNLALPQILKKSGMDAYVMMRPMEHEKHLPTVFLWQSPDGSTVPVFRIPFSYCCDFGTKEEMDARIRSVCDVTNADADTTMVFYGVGNHGGGPTKRNIGFIEELKETYAQEGVQLHYGGPNDFFARLQADSTPLPLHTDDLQHHASGCYSAVSAIKNANRLCETRLIAAEKYAAVAHALAGYPYPAEKLRTGWKNTLFNQFHDTLGGCSIKPAYQDALEFAGEALSIAAKVQNAALQTLSWEIDTSDGQYTPIVVFNPHSWPLRAPVRVNCPFGKALGMIQDPEGETVSCQPIRSESESCWNSPDSLFIAELPPMGWKVYHGYAVADQAESNEFRVSETLLENNRLRVTFDAATGRITGMLDKLNSRQLLDGEGARVIVIDETEHDTWSHGRNFFDREIGCFDNAETEVLECGTVRAVLKVTSRYNQSALTQIFMLYAGSDKLMVHCTIDWHEKHRMAKICYPAALTSPEAFYQIPYSHIQRPCDGEEESGQKWVALRGREGALAILNNNKYSFSAKDHTLMLTAVRSPIYADHGNVRTKESPYTDQGSHDFSYAVYAPSGFAFSDLDRAAEEFNTPPTVIKENNHSGTLPQQFAGAFTDSAHVLIAAVKQSEDQSGFIVRAYEADGTDTDCTLHLPALRCDVSLHFTPYTIKTLLITPSGCSEVNMIEF